MDPRDYQVIIQWSEDDACYIATIPAWQNVRTHGSTLVQAAKNAREVLCMLIDDAHKKGEPMPTRQKSYSGKLNVRLPKSLHEHLANEAEREGVSLNQWIITKLAS